MSGESGEIRSEERSGSLGILSQRVDEAYTVLRWLDDDLQALAFGQPEPGKKRLLALRQGADEFYGSLLHVHTQILTDDAVRNGGRLSLRDAWRLNEAQISDKEIVLLLHEQGLILLIGQTEKILFARFLKEGLIMGQFARSELRDQESVSERACFDPGKEGVVFNDSGRIRNLTRSFDLIFELGEAVRESKTIRYTNREVKSRFPRVDFRDGLIP
jgi:hypothetical protein